MLFIFVVVVVVVRVTLVLNAGHGPFIFESSRSPTTTRHIR